MDTEIQTFKKNIAKSNRKLARDIASWVSTAMSAEGKKSVNNSEDNDLGILGEEEGDGEEEEEVRGQQQDRKLTANK